MISSGLGALSGYFIYKSIANKQLKDNKSEELFSSIVCRLDKVPRGKKCILNYKLQSDQSIKCVTYYDRRCHTLEKRIPGDYRYKHMLHRFILHKNIPDINFERHPKDIFSPEFTSKFVCKNMPYTKSINYARKYHNRDITVHGAISKLVFIEESPELNNVYVYGYTDIDGKFKVEYISDDKYTLVDYLSYLVVVPYALSGIGLFCAAILMIK